MAQVVSRSPPTAGVPSLRLGPSMWVSWWTKRGLGRFSSGFLPFSPTTNFIPPFLHTQLIHSASFHPPLWWCDRRGRPAPLLFTDLQYRGFIASHPSTRPCVWHELRIFYINYISVTNFQPNISLWTTVRATFAKVFTDGSLWGPATHRYGWTLWLIFSCSFHWSSYD